MYKISVITVVFNDNVGLERTIRSVLSQTYESVEFIIVDGGSTDGTVDVIGKYKDRIDKWISEPDRGIYDAMNKGIQMATGEWLNFMNAGDVFKDVDVLKNIFSLSISNSVSFIYSDYWRSEKDGYYYLHDTNREKGIIHHQSSIYKRNLHSIYGFYITQKPYSVYDLLFFLSIPKDVFLKVPFEIAMTDGTGISNQGLWSWEKAEAARVLFNIKSLDNAFLSFLKIRLRSKISPSIIRFVRTYILGKKNSSLKLKMKD